MTAAGLCCGCRMQDSQPPNPGPLRSRRSVCAPRGPMQGEEVAEVLEAPGGFRVCFGGNASYA